MQMFSYFASHCGILIYLSRKPWISVIYYSNRHCVCVWAGAAARLVALLVGSKVTPRYLSRRGRYPPASARPCLLRAVSCAAFDAVLRNIAYVLNMHRRTRRLRRAA